MSGETYNAQREYLAEQARRIRDTDNGATSYAEQEQHRQRSVVPSFEAEDAAAVNPYADTSVTDVSDGWGIPGSVDEHAAVLWRRSLGALQAAAYANGIGAFDDEYDRDWKLERGRLDEVTAKYGLDPLHQSYQVLRMARSDSQLERAAELAKRNLDQDGYAATHHNGIFLDTLEVGAMFLDPAYVVAGVASAGAGFGAKSAQLAGALTKGQRAHIWGKTVLAESLIIDTPLEIARLYLDDNATLEGGALNIAISAITGYALGQAGTRLTFNEEKVLKEQLEVAQAKARGEPTITFDEAVEVATPLTIDVPEPAPSAPAGTDPFATPEATPKKNPYMGRKSFRGAEEARGQKPAELDNGSTLQGMIDDVNEDAVRGRLEDAQSVHPLMDDFYNPQEFSVKAAELSKAELKDAWASLFPAMPPLADNLSASEMVGKLERARRRRVNFDTASVSPSAPEPVFIELDLGTPVNDFDIRTSALGGLDNLSDGELFVGFEKVTGGRTPIKRDDALIPRGFGQWNYNGSVDLDAKGYFVPIANLEASPHDGIRQLTHTIVPNRGSDRIRQGATASEGSVRHMDDGAEFQRERAEAANRFWARYDRINPVTGGISDELISDFNRMVGAVYDEVDDLEYHPLFKAHGIDPEEFVKDPDVIAARDATFNDFDQNRVALQDPRHIKGDGASGSVAIPDPESDFSLGDEYVTKLRDWYASYVPEEASKADLDAAGKVGSRKGQVAGAGVGLFTSGVGAGALEFYDGDPLDDTHPAASIALMTVAAAMLGRTRGSMMARRQITQRRKAQNLRWKDAKPRFSVFAGENSPNADKDALATAQQLHADGASPDRIWKDTGWFQSAGTKDWLFEDLGAYAENLETASLPASLLAALPDDLIVRLQRDNPWAENVAGSMVRNEDGSIDVRIDKTRPEGQQLSTMIHEFQHVGQVAEDRLGKIEATFEKYLKTQHEAEARLSANRMGMTVAERQSIPPYRMYDVNIDDITHGAATGQPEEILRLAQERKIVQSPEYLAANSRFLGELTDDVHGGKTAWEIDLPDGSSIHYRLSPDGVDGQVEVEWDWKENVGSWDDEMVARSKTAAQQLQAFDLVTNQTLELMHAGTHKTMYFTGLTGGHARKQAKLISQHIGGTPYTGYVAETPPGLDGKTKAIFALVRTTEPDAEDVVQGLHRSQLEISTIGGEANSYRPFNPMAGNAANGVPYEGSVFAHGWVKDPKYFHRTFAGDKVRTVLAQPGNAQRLAAEIADAALKHPATMARFRRMFETASTGASLEQFIADRVSQMATKYVRVLRETHNLGKSGDGIQYAPRNKSAKAQAQAITEADIGRKLTPEEEEITKLFGEILAPAKEVSAPGFAKRKLGMKLSAKDHPLLMEVIDHDISMAANKVRSQSAGHVGYLRAGVRDANAVDRALAVFETAASKLPDADAQKGAARDIQMVGRLHDEVMRRAEGVSPKVSAVKKLLMSMTLGKVGLSMGGEIFKAAFSGTLPNVMQAAFRYNKLRDALKAGRFEELDPLYKLADDLHGGAQIQAATGGNIARLEADDGSAQMAQSGFERLARKAANATAKFSGMAPATVYMRALITGVWAERALKRARAGKPIEQSPTLLTRNGLDADMADRIGEQLRAMEATTSPITGQRTSDWSFNNWTDIEARDAFITYLDRIAKQKVQEVANGEVPNYFKSGTSSAFFQLLSFSTSSMNNWTPKVGRAVNPFSNVDGRARFHDLHGLTVGLAGSSLFAFAGLANKATTIADEDERETFVEETLSGTSPVMQRAIMYMPEAGVLPMGADVVAATFDFDPFFSGARNSDLESIGVEPQKSSPVSNLLGQGFDVVGGVAGATRSTIAGEEADWEKPLNKALRLAPMGNAVGVNAISSAAIEAAPSPDD